MAKGRGVNDKGQTAEQAYAYHLKAIGILVSDLQAALGTEFGMAGVDHDWAHVGSLSAIKRALLELHDSLPSA